MTRDRYKTLSEEEINEKENILEIYVRTCLTKTNKK